MKTFYKPYLMLLCMALANAVHAQDGNLDTSFDTDGIALAVSDTALAATDRAFGVAMQADGKLLVCGDAVNGSNGRYFLMRFNTNGSLDNSFGTDGVLRGFIGASTSTTGSVVRFLNNGKILLGGSTTLSGEQRWYVTRLNSNGSTDTTFGQSGIRIIDFDPASTVSQQLTDMKVRPDGKIILSGNYSTFVNRFWMLARLNEDGSFDNSFSSDGLFGIPTALVSGQLTELALTPDNKILVTGRVVISGAWYPGIIRITDDGLVDNSFSGDGLETYTITGLLASEAFGIEINPDRTIVLAGIARNILAGNNSDNMFVLKVNANGGLNAGFGTSGIATFDLVGGLQDQAYQLKILSNGKIVVAGASLRTTAAASRDAAVIRLNSNGTLDNTFGTLAGRTFIDGGSTAEDFGYNLFVRPNGKLVAVGQASVGGKIRAIVAQLNGTVAPQVVTGFRPELKGISTTLVLANSVALQATVNPGATSTSTVLQVSTAANFSTIVNSITRASGSGISDTTVSGTVTGLSPGTPYYARAIASNSNGNDTSASVSFFFNNILPSDSLALWLRSDIGVTTSNGTLVTGWADLSPKSNNVGIAPGISQPSLVNNAVNGLPAIRFDGTNDFLTSSKNLDVRNGPSIFIVAKNAVRKDVNAFLKISATHTQVNSHMDFYWQAGTSGNGNMVYAANRPASGFGGLAKARIYPNVGTVNTYYLASCVVPSNIAASGYFNGDSLINSTDNGTGVLLAQGTDLAQIGVLPPTGSFLNGDLVEMIVYNRPLTQVERIQVELYLANRYNLPLSYTPSASLDSVSNLTSSSAVLYAAVLPKSLGTQYSFEISTSTTFTNPITTTSGSLAAGTTITSVDRTVSGLTSGTLYYYRLKMTNPAGTFYSNNVGAFRHQTQIPTNGLRTWISADQAVQTTNQKVTAIYDLAEPRRYTSTDTATAPALVTNVLNGKPVLRYDGSNDVLVGNKTIDLRTNFTTIVVFKNRVRKSYNGLFRVAAALTGESSNLEIFSDGTGTGNGLQFLTINRGPSAGQSTLECSNSGNSFSPGTYYVWVEQKSQSGPAAGLRLINNSTITQTVGGNNQNIRTPLAINTPYVGVGYNGTGFSGNKYLDGDIAEIIAYNRVLTTLEIDQLHVYLDAKYNFGFLPSKIQYEANAFSKINSSVMAVNFIVNTEGTSGTYQVQYTAGPNFNTFDTLPRQSFTGNPISLNASQNIPASVRYGLYKVRIIMSNSSGNDTSEIREFISPNIGFSDLNLRAWLRADGGIVFDSVNTVKVKRMYNLRSSTGSFISVNQPSVSLMPSVDSNAVNGKPAINLTSDILISSEAMSLSNFTITLVMQSQGAGLAYEHGGNITSASSYLWTGSGNTILTTRGGLVSSFTNPVSGWALGSYKIVTHQYGGTHSSHRLLVNAQVQTLNTGTGSSPSGSALGNLFVGGRNGNQLFMDGQIAEMIITADYLQGTDLDSLHAYLAQRYNIGLVTGIADQLFDEANSSFLFYPNPAADQLNVIIKNDGAKNVEIKIYSLDGRVLNSYKLEAENDAITGNLDISTLGAGIYMIELSTNEKTVRKKLIKE